jgi:hypothetical protein
MKNISKLILFTLLLPAIFTACKKDEHKDYYLGGTAPVLAASTSAVGLSYATKDQQAMSFNWTNPNYQFTTGISSQDVSYTLEIDTMGSNFTNPNKQSISVSKDLSVSLTQSQLNDYLLNQLQLQTGVQHNMQARVKSTIGTTAALLISNVVNFTAIPYAIPPKVQPPGSGQLFLVGDATNGGWNNPVPVPSQQFTQVSPTFYSITVSLIGGKQYLFIPVNGDWSHKFACHSTAGQAATGGDFGYDWTDNFPGPAASGTYKIDVDFQRGKYTVTKQ